MKLRLSVLLLVRAAVLIPLAQMLDVLAVARTRMLQFNTRMLYSSASPAATTLTSAIDELAPDSLEELRVLRALLFIGNGELDEAHEIVQSMGSPDALYVHALLHRLEGRHIGEGAMRGWSNADYWNDQLGEIHPNFPKICDFVHSPHCAVYSSSSDRVAAFSQRLIAQSRWEPSVFLGLCINAFKYDDQVCVQFCQDVTTFEFNLLLSSYCPKLQSS